MFQELCVGDGGFNMIWVLLFNILTVNYRDAQANVNGLPESICKILDIWTPIFFWVGRSWCFVEFSNECYRQRNTQLNFSVVSTIYERGKNRKPVRDALVGSEKAHSYNFADWIHQKSPAGSSQLCPRWLSAIPPFSCWALVMLPCSCYLLKSLFLCTSYFTHLFERVPAKSR